LLDERRSSILLFMRTRFRRILEVVAGVGLTATSFPEDPQPPAEALETTQERAYTSPIWYTP
jgi:hypothetical protein